MQPCQWEIIILKPTRIFLTFLANQLPGISLPQLRQMQMDPTAYIIHKWNSDEETFNEIEHHYLTMFRQEISRWLGKNAYNKIEGTFLDFLCCFKFELHSRIVLMEDSIEKSQQLIRVKPRSVLLSWLKSAAPEESEFKTVLERVNLSNLKENSTVILKNFSDCDAIKAFIRDHYYAIFEAEMFRMWEQDQDWPLINSYQEFCRYFTVQTHSRLINLCE